MKNIVMACLLSFFTASLAAADPGDDLDFSVIKPKSEEPAQDQGNPSVMATTEGEGCYVNDPRINNLAAVLADIEAGKEIEPLKMKISTYLEFSSTYINKLGRKNVHIITEEACASYPTELDDLPFKVAMDFDEIYNRLTAALLDDDEIKARFIARNVISRPIDLNGAISLLTKNEIDKDLAAKISRFTSARPVKDNTRQQDVEKGNYKAYLIPLDLFRATGGKVTGSDLSVGLAMYGLGACHGMDSSVFYTSGGIESSGWLPGFRDKDEPYLRARSLLKGFGVKVNQVECKEYLQNAG
ncbi:MAG: hypothetical protein MJA28_05990 [Gammaproteobacteria bacterium]|nr:hypothetical protein [Gammaproteobacteria bacterium]